MTTAPQKLIDLLSTKDFPPQRPFSYSRASWARWLGHIDGMLDFLNDLPATLNRESVALEVERTLEGFPAGAFTTAMIWGYGGAGYGPYRTAYILTRSREQGGSPLSKDNVAQLTSAAQIAQQSGAEAGYRYLNNTPGKLPGLGPAFFTKWLYFVTTDEGRNLARTAPILDRLVIRWLDTEASIKITPSQTSDYSRYIDVLRDWGADFDLTPADVEERIFRLIRGDGMPTVGPQKP